jgi:hypothetical protein
MHRAIVLDLDESNANPRVRTLTLPAGLLLPWCWARLFDARIRRAAARDRCSFVHFGVDFVIHLPDASYAVPWREVRAACDGTVWQIRAGGMLFSVVDGQLATWERRRLEY